MSMGGAFAVLAALSPHEALAAEAGGLLGPAGSPRWWAAVAGLAVGTGLAVMRIRRMGR